jgi:two-component system response regulator EvgA
MEGVINMANIIIVDDQPLIRYAVCTLLENEGHMIKGEICFDLVINSLTHDFKPDVLILDLNAFDVQENDLIKLMESNIRVIVLTCRDDELFLNRCINMGVAGFVSKIHDLEELVDAVSAVLKGYSYFPLRHNYIQKKSLPQLEFASLVNLSRREIQVLGFLVHGEKIVNIASEMSLSNKTVSTYKTRILSKLGLSSNEELIDFAHKYGLI